MPGVSIVQENTTIILSLLIFPIQRTFSIITVDLDGRDAMPGVSIVQENKHNLFPFP